MSKVVIAGGGLVGSLLGLMLSRRKHELHIYEKRADLRKAQIAAGRSINLVITSRGWNALQFLGLRDSVMKLTVPVRGRMIHSIKGEQIFQPYGGDGECNYSISRAELNRFLLTELDKQKVSIHFEESMTSIDFDSKQVSFSSGKKVSYDVLFGAEGAGSVLRGAMKEKAGFSESTEFLSSDYKELYIPLSPSGQPQLEKEVLHIWPRGHHMMMALPNLDGSFTVTLYMPKQGAYPSFADMKTAEDIQELFEHSFPDAIPLIDSLSENFFSNPQGVLGTVRSSPWYYQDSVALIGDAAHAIVPFFGQGMNLGFEDCFYLNQFLDQHHENWAEALANFDQFQRPNADAIADMALENFVEMSEKVGDPQFLLRKKVEAYLEKEFPEVYRSRYGMITYTLIPYKQAQSAGLIQDQILNELCRNLKSLEDLDRNLARNLIQKHLQ